MRWAWVGIPAPPLEDDACHDEHLHAPVLRGLHVLVLHVSTKGRRGRRHACVGRGFRRWKMTIDKLNTFTLPSSAAPDTSSATSCAMSCAMSCAASFKCSSFTCRPSADLAPPTPNAKARGRLEKFDLKRFDEWSLNAADFCLAVRRGRLRRSRYYCRFPSPRNKPRLELYSYLRRAKSPFLELISSDCSMAVAFVGQTNVCLLI